MVFPSSTHLRFNHYLFITIKINQLFCGSCLTVCQCTQTVYYLTSINVLAYLFKVEYVKFEKPTTSNLQASVHFRYALEHLHFIDMHFVLHERLIGCMHTAVIAS